MFLPHRTRALLFPVLLLHRPHTGGVKVPSLFKGEFRAAQGPHKLSMHLVNIDSSVEDLMS